MQHVEPAEMVLKEGHGIVAVGFTPGVVLLLEHHVPIGPVEQPLVVHHTDHMVEVRPYHIGADVTDV